jgi:GDPmannose 4,6-dehydratase
MSKRALITGINGMDGSHLADFLLTKNYEVFGLERRASTKNRTNTAHLEEKITFIQGDLTDQNSLLRALKVCDPDEIYNLASQSFVGESWNTPEQTSDVTGLGVLRMLEAIREFDTNKKIKFYQASSSEMFGNQTTELMDETTPFSPRSPYGVSKLYGHHITVNYRESYGMYNCCGILFNHESERRGLEFVTRKISDGVAKIRLGIQNHITLGNLEARRDWGYAPEYVKAMWAMLQQKEPTDFVIATGKSHSIKDFLDVAFTHIGYETWRHCIKQDPRFMRPAEVNVLRGDSAFARQELGWSPKVSFKELVIKMVDSDLARLQS